jgi:galactokinase
VVEEIGRVERACAALEKNDFYSLGKLMFEGHAGLDQEYAVCVPETNFLVETARLFVREGDVLGARQMGGGFGGCILCLVRSETQTSVAEKLNSLYKQRFGIELKVYPVRLMGGTEHCA